MANLQDITNPSQIGTIKPWAKTTAPDGYILCDGASLVRTGTYASLFAIIGTTYGSADGTHFNVPNLEGRTPQGYDGNTYNLAATGGANTVTVSVTNNQSLTDNQAATVTGTIANTSLSTAQLASHTHTQVSHSAWDAPSPIKSDGFFYAASPQGPHSMNNTGSGTGHTHTHTLSGTFTGNVALTGTVAATGTNTFSPYVVVNYIIKF